MKKRNCTIRVAKTKVLISFAVTAKLICVFVFAYAEFLFSHAKAHTAKLLFRDHTWLQTCESPRGFEHGLVIEELFINAQYHHSVGVET